jgi:two-component system chemotaxis response regulator CheY
LDFSNISEADDGPTVLPMLKDRNFDLLTTDWNMPQMNGLELLKAVRSDERLASLPTLRGYRRG